MPSLFWSCFVANRQSVQFSLKKKKNVITSLYLQITCGFIICIPVAEPSRYTLFLCLWDFCITVKLSLIAALDREACHTRTVIIPELMSPLSIELLRRWRGQKIQCRERQHCSAPSSPGVKTQDGRCRETGPSQMIQLSLSFPAAHVGHLKKLSINSTNRAVCRTGREKQHWEFCKYYCLLIQKVFHPLRRLLNHRDRRHT